LMSICVFAFADALAGRALNSARLAPELRLVCALLFVNTINGAQSGALAGLESFKLIAKVNLVKGLLNFPIAIIGTWMMGLHGAVAALIVAGAAGSLLSHFGLQRQCKREGIVIRYRHCVRELPIIWRFSLPALLNELIMGPAMWLGSAILARYPAGYSELGLLNVGQQWRRILLFLPSVFASVTLPILSAEQHTNRRRFTDVLEMAQSLSIVTVVPVAAMIMCMSEYIVRLYGRDFTGASPVLLGIVVGAAVSAIASAGSPGIRARGRMWFETFQSVTWGGVYITFAAVFCPHWGALALSGGFAVACSIHSICSYIYLYFTGDVTAAMLSRIVGAVAFVVVAALLSLWADGGSRVWILSPIVLLSVVLSVSVWLPESARSAIGDSARSFIGALSKKASANGSV
jgi:O-antigen/teichoic acid export membrane protein